VSRPTSTNIYRNPKAAADLQICVAFLAPTKQEVVFLELLRVVFKVSLVRNAIFWSYSHIVLLTVLSDVQNLIGA